MTTTQRDRALRFLRSRLASSKITYRQVAAEAGVSWSMVYQVLHGRKVSAKVVEAATKLCA